MKYLILADGTVFQGKGIGANGDAIGEVVFNTSIVGYMETLTDPSYYGQLVAQTFPLIGNYGKIEVDVESKKSYVSGYIVRELCDEGSNFRKEGELNDFLISQDISGICDIDTRQLTRIIRDKGVMNGMITDNLKRFDEKLNRIRNYKIQHAVISTTVEKVEEIGDGNITIAVWDFGATNSLINEFVNRGAKVIRVPSFATAEEILALNPDGIVLSSGGGDPAENVTIISQLKKLNAKKIPTFAIGLGHQLLAIAMGGKTRKLKYGHRGANQTVKDSLTGRTYITTQNHGYAVVSKSIPEEVGTIRMINANDKTVEGITYNSFPAFSVQFIPGGGSTNTDYLYDMFIDMVRGNK